MHTEMTEAKPRPTNKIEKETTRPRKSESGLLSALEAAEYIHPIVKEATIKRLIREGQLSAVKVGRSYLVSVEEVERYLECQGKGSQQDSINEKTTARGSSSMADGTSGLDMVKVFLEKRKKH